ncbi:solute carrier family 23 protein [Novosphingobium resinovorum]|uniref:uracil-xanthine permease family protein n=1 Tax=Novosphingobium TaxID=165696 RepID=UPI000B151CE9|nr:MULTISPECIES: solute carrier family 23 protein [Novosphingobium]MBF7014865.1 purine/pyrimidine permease [Novosphingobium sp. HR1a]WJM24657.1 solute carrier family 23 protein [Novosphingobium resinovorum]
MSSAPALEVGFEDRIGFAPTLFFAAQHLLALTGVWVFPSIIGTILGLSLIQTSHIVQACLFTTGVVTLLQSGRMLRLPVVQGPTGVFLMTTIAVAQAYGLDAVYGSMLAAACLFALLALPIPGLDLIGRLTRSAANPIVYAMLLVIVGVQLSSVGLANWFGPDPAAPQLVSFLLASFSALTVIACLVFGGQGLVKKGGLVIGVAAGSAAAALMGQWQLPALGEVTPLGLPALAPFGLKVVPAAVFVMVFAFLHASIETVGMYSVLCSWAGRPLTRAVANQGLFVEYLGCAAGALFGGLGTTSYPENIAIIRVSRVGSRFVTMTAGALAIALSMLPQLALLIASIPAPVIGAVSTILFGIIAVNGIQMAREIEWDDLNIAVAAPAFILASGALFLPDPVKARLPAYLLPLLSQPMVIGSMLLIVLNLLVNDIVRPLIEREAQGAA